VGGHFGLVARDAILAPGEQGDAFGEKCLESPFGFEAGDDAGAMAVPVFEGLDLRNDKRFERRPCLLALRFDAALPPEVFGPRV